MALSRRSGFGICANKLKRPLDFDTSLFQNGDGDGGPLRGRDSIAGAGLSPEVLKSIRRKFGVTHRVLDVLVPEPASLRLTNSRGSHKPLVLPEFPKPIR